MKVKRLAILICFLLLCLCGCSQTDLNKNNNQNNDQTQNTNESKDLRVAVIYFSCTSNTENVANIIANYYNINAIEIEAKIPYTSADLNYSNSNSRTSIEQNDESARPEIKNEIDISSYDYIYLGYPIWWGQAPKIMYTFIESHNLENKTIIPFCTSASSGIGSSATNLSKNQNGIWLTGRRFSANESKTNIEDWIESLKLAK